MFERMRQGRLFLVGAAAHVIWWDRGEERYTIADQMDRGRERAASLDIHLLMDESADIAGIRLLGETLWTNFRLGSFSMTHGFRTAQGRDGMVDYRRIRTGQRSRDLIEPEEVFAMHRATRAFLDAELARPHDGPTVVVTHHAPHPESLPDRHAHLAWCDVTDLTDIMARGGPDLSVHGHVHHADYRMGRTRVVCNARGHNEENLAFRPGMAVDLQQNAELS